MVGAHQRKVNFGVFLSSTNTLWRIFDYRTGSIFKLGGQLRGPTPTQRLRRQLHVRAFAISRIFPKLKQTSSKRRKFSLQLRLYVVNNGTGCYWSLLAIITSSKHLGSTGKRWTQTCLHYEEMNIAITMIMKLNMFALWRDDCNHYDDIARHLC